MNLTREQQLSQQLDRIYALIQDGLDQDLVMVEFRRAVELFTEKYASLLDEAATTQKKAALQDRYVTDINQLAAAIDQAIERRSH